TAGRRPSRRVKSWVRPSARYASTVSRASKYSTATLLAAGGAGRAAGLPHGGGEPSAHWAGRRAADTALASARTTTSRVRFTALRSLPPRHTLARDRDLGPRSIGLGHQVRSEEHTSELQSR